MNSQDDGDDLFRADSWGWTTSAPSTARTLPFAARLEQSDATAWMFAYCLSMLAMAGS